MLVPMLQSRKPPGLRGERLVAYMRATGRGGRLVPQSAFKAGQTGTVALKSFRGAGSGSQPVIAARIAGGIRPASFGD